MVMGLTSCLDNPDDPVEINNTAPAQVTDVQAVPGNGEVTLSWTIPASESFMYAKVEYLTSNGEERYQIYSKDRADANGRMSATITGFANTNEVTFSIYACAVKGASLDPVTVLQAPGNPAFIEVARSVEVTSDLGSVQVSWDNQFPSVTTILVNYYSASDASRSGSYSFAVEGNTQGSREVYLWVDDGLVFLSGEECVVEISTQDSEANTSEVYSFNVTPQPLQQLPRTTWTFPGYDDTSSAGTIGYSSQEASGEGASPSGRVIALIDGNLSTYWHTTWQGSTAPFPHWFIVDMGSDQQISHVGLRRRQGDNRGQVGHTISICPEAGAADPSNPDGWAWQEQGSYSFDINNDAEQIYRLPSVATARYIRVYIGEEYRGSGANAMLSEFNAYTPEY